MSNPATTPAPATARDTARAIESTVARVLVVGTWIAVGLVLVGVLGMLVTGVDPLEHGASPGFDLGAAVDDLLALHPVGFLWAGLVTVLLLPIGRVIVSGAGFMAAGDRRLALVSLAVLLVVLVSIAAALGLEG